MSEATTHEETTIELDEVEKLTEALAAPFDLREVKFKPAVISGTRALALAYVDARVIQDRLDDVLGVTGWQDEYESLPDGSVVCRLRLRIGDEWITKMDVGGQSEQPDEGDRRKAAFSDALKRAAVKFGVGRYLYRLPQLWVDYDPHKKQFRSPPTLPPSALPMPGVRGQGSGVREDKGRGQKSEVRSQKAEVRPDSLNKGVSPTSTPKLPSNGVELQRRLYDYDARLAKQGVCQPGELVKYVVQAGVKAGFEADLATWSGPAIQLAVEETKAFEGRVRPKEVA